jgi:hypothetical protein
VAVGKGKLFWFFSVGFVRWQKPNVLDRAVAFFQLAGNGLCIFQWRPKKHSPYFYSRKVRK